MKTIVQQIDWAEVGQIVLQGLITLAVLTYLAGWYLGRWLHRANDQLARFWVQLVLPADLSNLGEVAKPQSQTDLIQMDKVAHTPPAPMQHPLAEVAAELLELTAAELRSVLGTRQRCSKAQLVAAACSW